MVTINRTMSYPGTVVRVDTIDGKVTTSYSTALQERQTLNRTWARTPNYWVKRQLDERVPVNPYTRVSEHVVIPYGTWQYLWIPNGNRNDYTGPWPEGYGSRTYLSTPTSVINTMNAECEARMLSEIKAEKVNWGNALAEFNQTTKLIGDTARVLASAFVNLKRGRFLRAAQDLGVPLGTSRIKRAAGRYNRLYPKDPSSAAANGWLALHFGWTPLLSDIHDSCEAIANWKYEKKAPIQTSRVKVKRACFAREAPPGGFVTTYDTTTTIKYVCSYRASKADFKRLQTVGLTNPLSIAWEVMPWSFVVDWFLPVGRWLGNLDALVGVEFVDASWTKIDEQVIDMQIDSSSVKGSTRYTYKLKGATKMVTIHRSPSNPPSVLTLPRFKSPFSTLHAVTGLALLRQVFL